MVLVSKIVDTQWTDKDNAVCKIYTTSLLTLLFLRISDEVTPIVTELQVSDIVAFFL